MARFGSRNVYCEYVQEVQLKLNCDIALPPPQIAALVESAKRPGLASLTRCDIRPGGRGGVGRGGREGDDEMTDDETNLSRDNKRWKKMKSM